MAKRQTRRSISVRGVTYDRLRDYTATASMSMSDFVELRIAQWFDAHPGMLPMRPGIEQSRHLQPPMLHDPRGDTYKAPAPTKPRLRFCWECSRQLQGNSFRSVVRDGQTVEVHVECVDGVPAYKDPIPPVSNRVAVAPIRRTRVEKAPKKHVAMPERTKVPPVPLEQRHPDAAQWRIPR